MSQVRLPTMRASHSHANLGKEFEDCLDRAHALYETQGRAKIYHIPNAFEYTTDAAYLRLDRYMKARLGTGRAMVRTKTPFDYSGVITGGRAIAFDAKQFSRTNLPLSDLKPHQVDNLCAFQRAGGLAGFMISAKATGRVFWLRADVAQVMCAGAKFLKSAPKSLNISWLEKHAVEIPHRAGSMMVDWLPILE